MGILQRIFGSKDGIRPHRIVFEEENPDNVHINWKDGMKPRIEIEDGITPEEAEILTSRLDEMLSQAEEIMWRRYLDPRSDELLSGEDFFPSIRRLTGNYYVGSVSYDIMFRDEEQRYYHLKDGRLLHEYHDGEDWVKEWLPLDSQAVTRYYQIILDLRLTGRQDGEEDDYMGLELEAELTEPDAPLEFEVLSHDVI